jgi:hypothetical protein
MTGTIAGAVWTAEGLRVECDVAITGRMALPRQILCVLVGSEDIGASAFALRRDPEEPSYGAPARYAGVFATASIRDLVPGTYDVRVVARVRGDRVAARPAWAVDVPVPRPRDGFAPYATKSGGFAVKKREESVLARIAGLGS